MNDVLQDIPDEEARKILDEARQEIARILAKTNGILRGNNLGMYSAVAGALYYNDPQNLCDVPCIAILLESTPPLQSVEPEELTIPVYSEDQGVFLRDIKLESYAQITSGQCNKKNKGRRCGGGNTCKEVFLYGHPLAYECLPSD